MLRDRWLFTGDLGYMDEDGYLFVVDRKKDLIKPGGFQVWPREVEEVIASHPAVAQVGVTGIPDQLRGEAALPAPALLVSWKIGLGPSGPGPFTFTAMRRIG
jgi:acyl-CoA synthetase (AMP-forming)/AMP-acid ligase II